MTELVQILGEMEKLRPEAGRLAAHLRELGRDFRMEEILGTLESVA